MTLIATAGHVDHGKTSLVRRLTGVDTDRLEEEKQRGLTIELGYAFRDGPSGERMGFIDVPGHDRFINTMIAGVTGIDLGMLVVAADDGIMPQTREHLEVLRLLGVERFVGVISKSDLVDDDRLSQVESQLAELLPETPFIRISSKTGEGIEHLLSLLSNQKYTRAMPSHGELFRLYIDRVFVKKGAGLVVTGTCLSGSVAADDSLYLHSVNARDPLPVRVRAVHSQGKAATNGQAGQRCALNIAGKASREQLQRGGFICAHSRAAPSRRLDTRCGVLRGAEHPLKHLGRVKLHIGTRRIAAATYLLERDVQSKESIAPGLRVQLILDNPVVAFAGDRFVLRSDDESVTLGGGIVIDPVAPQWGKSRQHRLQQLDALELENPAATLQQMLFEWNETVSTKWLERIWNLSSEALGELLAQCGSKNIVRVRHADDELIVSGERWLHYIKMLTQVLSEWHSRHPMDPGIDPALLQRKTEGVLPKALFRPILDDQLNTGQLIYREQLVHVLGHRPTLSHQVQREWQMLAHFFQRQGLQPPLRSEILTETGWDGEQLERLVRPAIKRNDLLEIGEKRLALPATLVQLAELVQAHFKVNASLSVIEAKQLFGLGRGVTIEILEFMDSIGFTSRSGNQREIANLEAAQQLLR